MGIVLCFIVCRSSYHNLRFVYFERSYSQGELFNSRLDPWEQKLCYSIVAPSILSVGCLVVAIVVLTQYTTLVDEPTCGAFDSAADCQNAYCVWDGTSCNRQ